MKSVLPIHNRRPEIDMLDLYNSKPKHAYCIFKAKTEIDDSERTDVKSIEYLHKKDKKYS